MSARDMQVAGDHYKNMAIQPIELITVFHLSYCEAACVGYVSRWKDKGGIDDLRKAKHCLEMRLEMYHDWGIDDGFEREASWVVLLDLYCRQLDERESEIVRYVATRYEDVDDAVSGLVVAIELLDEMIKTEADKVCM